MSQDIATSTPTQTAIRYATKAAIVTALISLWAMQYALWVPAVWLWRTAVVLAKFATHSAGYIILLILFPIGWIILAILMLRSGPAKVQADHGYMRPWFAGALKD